jgi:HEPN domain-containing protein
LTPVEIQAIQKLLKALDQQQQPEQPKVKAIRNFFKEITQLWQQAPELDQGVYSIGDYIYW